jgi:hypothetical protein
MGVMTEKMVEIGETVEVAGPRTSAIGKEMSHRSEIHLMQRRLRRLRSRWSRCGRFPRSLRQRWLDCQRRSPMRSGRDDGQVVIWGRAGAGDVGSYPANCVDGGKCGGGEGMGDVRTAVWWSCGTWQR